MKIDNLEQYINVREALIQEKAELEARLSRIQEALGEVAETATTSTQNRQRQQPAAASHGGPRRGRPPVGGGQSLREVVASVLQNSTPLTKQEVLERVVRTGYKFTTKNPLNSLGVILYGKGNGFTRENGRFSLQGGSRAKGSNGTGSYSSSNGTSASGTTQSPGAKTSQGGSGRKMSDEARARIAAAARARWKKAKSEGKSRL